MLGALAFIGIILLIAGLACWAGSGKPLGGEHSKAHNDHSTSWGGGGG